MGCRVGEGQAVGSGGSAAGGLEHQAPSQLAITPDATHPRTGSSCPGVCA